MNNKTLIEWSLLYLCIVWLILMIILTIVLPILYGAQWTYASPYWYRDLMNTMYIGWVVLSIFTSFSIGYLIWDHQKKKISKMSDEEIVDYYMTHGI